MNYNKKNGKTVYGSSEYKNQNQKNQIDYIFMLTLETSLMLSMVCFM